MLNPIGRPVVVVNTLGFYDGSISQLRRASEDGILRHKPDEVNTVCIHCHYRRSDCDLQVMKVVATPEEALAYVLDHPTCREATHATRAKL